MVRSSRGFSLIELLVVMGVLAIVLSLALPALSKAKEAARRAKCLAQIRNHQQLLFAYAISYDDQVPYIWSKVRTPPDEIPYPPPPGSPDWYLAVSSLWHVPMMDSFGGNGLHETLFCPSNTELDSLEALMHEAEVANPKQMQGTRDYSLSNALFLDPEALDPDDPNPDHQYYVPQRLSEIAFPSDKAFLIDSGPPYHDPRWRRVGVFATPPYDQIVGWSDGSAVLLNTAEIIPGLIMNPTGDTDLDRIRSELAKLDFTPWGVRGRDR